jgi:hypothetical protein
MNVFVFKTTNVHLDPVRLEEHYMLNEVCCLQRLRNPFNALVSILALSSIR